MKRVLLVVLGALVGAIGLPVLMWCSTTMSDFLLSYARVHPVSLLRFFVSYWNKLPLTFASGLLMGGLTMMLWRGQRTPLERVACCVGAVGTLLPIYNNASGWVDIFGSWINVPTYDYEALLAQYLPSILWSLALFLFAVLARRKSPGEPLL